MKTKLKQNLHRKRLQLVFTAHRKNHVVSGRDAQALGFLVVAGNKGISHLEMQDMKGGYRLSAQVYNLRRGYGLEIDDSWEFIDKLRFKRYHLRTAVDIKHVGSV